MRSAATLRSTRGWTKTSSSSKAAAVWALQIGLQDLLILPTNRDSWASLSTRVQHPVPALPLPWQLRLAHGFLPQSSFPAFHTRVYPYLSTFISPLGFSPCFPRLNSDWTPKSRSEPACGTHIPVQVSLWPSPVSAQSARERFHSRCLIPGF